MNWLPPSAAHSAAKHKPDKPVTTQGRGTEGHREAEDNGRERESMRRQRDGNGAKGQMKQKRPLTAETTKASCLCGIY